MRRYIDADYLIDDLLDYAKHNKGTYHEEGFMNAITVVEDQPKAYVVDKQAYDAILEELCRVKGQLEREQQLVRDLIKEQGLRYEHTTERGEYGTH